MNRQMAETFLNRLSRQLDRIPDSDAVREMRRIVGEQPAEITKALCDAIVLEGKTLIAVFEVQGGLELRFANGMNMLVTGHIEIVPARCTGDMN